MSQTRLLALKSAGRLSQQSQRFGIKNFGHLLNHQKRWISPAPLKFAKVAVRETHVVGERLQRHALCAPDFPHVPTKGLRQPHRC